MHEILHTDFADYKLKERRDLTPEDEANVKEFDDEFFLKQFLDSECMSHENITTLREVLASWYYVSPVYLDHPRDIMNQAGFFILSGELKLIEIVEPVLSGGVVRSSGVLGVGFGKPSFYNAVEIGAPQNMPTEMGSSRLLTFIDQFGQFIQLTNKITVFSQLYSHALNHAPNRSFVVDLKTGTDVL